MDDLRALVAEDALEVEVLGVQLQPDLTGAVVPDPRATIAVAGVGDVELVAVAPSSALRQIRTLEIHEARGQVRLDHQ